MITYRIISIITVFVIICTNLGLHKIRTVRKLESKKEEGKGWQYLKRSVEGYQPVGLIVSVSAKQQCHSHRCQKNKKNIHPTAGATTTIVESPLDVNYSQAISNMSNENDITLVNITEPSSEEGSGVLRDNSTSDGSNSQYYYNHEYYYEEQVELEKENNSDTNSE
uniref:Uncharacterized protein n=1 Tax=Bracon brevicornis TaxID=1563983 RepID=A0A6V7IAL1_9HYME